jgi:RNA polymerase sigma-70 factor (ECF subfamily)
MSSASRAAALGLVVERTGAGDPPPDASLLERIRSDDAGALDILLARYWSPVFAYALRMTRSRDVAADVAQEVFCRLWDRRASWRPGDSVRGLLFRLARNTSVTEHRRQRVRERATDGFVELYLERTPALLSAERAELRAALEREIAALPPRRREVFLLRMVHDLSYEEIAGVMGTSKQTVANQLSHALATLRRVLAHLLD